MLYKTILSFVGVNRFETDVRDAISAAQSVDAHLSVVVVAMPARPPLGHYAELVSVAWLEERQDIISKLSGQIGIAEEMLKTSGLSFDIRDLYTEYAWADEDMAASAFYADLVLVASQAAQDPDICKRILDGVLFQSPTPVLFNRTSKDSDLAPRSVIVAWDSRVEAARSIRQALPVLQTASNVYLSMVDPVATPLANGEEPGADIARYLARHGVTVAVDVSSTAGRSVGETLKRHADDVAADLIVMGAYSHSRLRELVFGGVTQAMLETAGIPIFLCH